MHTKTFFFLRILSAITLFAMMISGCNQGEISRDSDVAVPVSVTEANYEAISEFLQTTGTVNAVHSAELVTKVEGDYFLQTNPRTNQKFALGDQIKEGETLIKLKNREYELGIQIESVKLEQKIAKQEYEKQQALYEKGGVTLRELTNAEKTYINAQNALEEAKLNLNKLSVTAPITGFITQLPYYTPGTHMNANTNVAKIMDYRELMLEVSFPEKTLPIIQTGQQVRINHYSLDTAQALEGRVTEISPAVDPDTRMFDAKIRVQNQQKRLRPGMFVKANVMVEHKDSVITLPREIVLERNDRQIVYVVQQDRAHERNVVTGIESGDRVEIIDGIEEDERVVTDGYETLRDRSRVKVLQ
ncbi:MAG: efflux RND transporter periplasmic adaptor subunit [Bacteroidales bacterium]|nr:efflux RND transporter periplasmic adaptor subunit [Bacteroidales bacterium]